MISSTGSSVLSVKYFVSVWCPEVFGSINSVVSAEVLNVSGVYVSFHCGVPNYRRGSSVVQRNI